MRLKLPALTEEELRLLLALLRTELHGPPTESGRRAGFREAPIEPIRRLARTFEEYAKRNKGIYGVAEGAWLPDPGSVHVAAGVDMEEALERLTRHQWRSVCDELRRVLAESRQVKWWGFRLPVMLPSGRVFVFRPDDLILNWLAARLVANNQQFRLVPRCRTCGKAGLRERARKSNVYCSDECKRRGILQERRRERARQRERQEEEPSLTRESFREVKSPTKEAKAPELAAGIHGKKKRTWRSFP